jgi:tungstate transport system permease protein
MNDLLNGLIEALRLLMSSDTALGEIVSLSLYVSGVALVLGALIGLPLGVLLALTRFPGRRLLIALVYTGMGLPPVVIGLVVYLLLSRSGPLGGLGWLFTPSAMIMAQTILSMPLIAGFTMSAIQAIDPALSTQLAALGASPLQISLALLWEARMGVLVAVIAGFGSIISEVGAVMLVGGNIEGATRVLTTAIVLETRKGEFAMAIALAAILLAITFAINAAALLLQQRMVRR